MNKRAKKKAEKLTRAKIHKALDYVLDINGIEERKGMDDSQITGSASSYARKYALNGLLLLDDTKDTDTDEYREQQDDKAASSAQKKTIESICKAHGIDVSQICKLNSLDWKTITETQAGKLLLSLKRKFGDE